MAITLPLKPNVYEVRANTRTWYKNEREYAREPLQCRTIYAHLNGRMSETHYFLESVDQEQFELVRKLGDSYRVLSEVPFMKDSLFNPYDAPGLVTRFSSSL